MSSSDTTTSPIPTDEQGLYEHLKSIDSLHWSEVTDQLAEQMGNKHSAYALMDRVTADIRNEREIEELRKCLRRHLTDALASVAAADATLRNLSSNEVYDVEYAEGGPAVSDMRSFLCEAARAVRGAQALNPIKEDGRLGAEVARMKPVIAAAEAWRAMCDDAEADNPRAIEDALADAVDAYKKGRTQG